jgi:large subunit ribosomal protein L7/L12
MAKFTKEEFIEGLKEMSLLEIKELVDAMKEAFGVDPTAVAVAGPAQAAAAPAEEEGPKEVSVILENAGASKVAVIKVVRTITGLGLIEAKGIVDKAPTPVKEKIAPEEAENIKKQLEEAGATVSIK